MSGSTIIEVAIGLVFTYLALSLTCSALFELFASYLNLRADNLARALDNMLGDKLYQNISSSPLLLSLALPGRRPSYMSAATFARIVQGSGKQTDEFESWLEDLPEGRGKEVIRSLSVQAGDDPAKLRSELEAWYNSAMERASGWYKRKAQKVLLVLALIFSVALNADTLMITNMLWQNPQLRAQMVSAAEQSLAQMEHPEKLSTERTTDEALSRGKVAIEQLKTIPFPLGWRDEPGYRPTSAGEWVLKLVGLLITALAAAQGAPFWFDLLNKLTNLRGSGSRPVSEQHPKG